MKYTVTDVTTSHILVKFEDETFAQIPYKEDWTSDELNNEILKYIPDIVAVIDGEEVVIPRGEYNEH
tara:strand:+ start:34 stop:234 length:201 start_codon:yes stop_codon:yes gene_type:complete